MRVQTDQNSVSGPAANRRYAGSDLFRPSIEDIRTVFRLIGGLDDEVLTALDVNNLQYPANIRLGDQPKGRWIGLVVCPSVLKGWTASIEEALDDFFSRDAVPVAQLLFHLSGNLEVQASLRSSSGQEVYICA